MLKIGSLCTGYGGLDMAVEAYFGAETVWTSDIDKHASIVIEQRIGKPNLGDLKKIDWTRVEPIDILTAGYPCQPFSTAGQRKGTQDERHIFPYIMQAVGVLRPRIIILENVRGHLTLGFKEVLKELTNNGYDAKWRVVRASDAGAPHRRERLFIVAYPNSNACKESRRAHSSIYGQTSQILDRPNRHEFRSSSSIVTDTEINRIQDRKTTVRYESSSEMSMRRPPNPLDNDRLNAKFVEYMMGLPEGWVTDLPIIRSHQLKILGNGVVPQQAYLALQLLLGD